MPLTARSTSCNGSPADSGEPLITSSLFGVFDGRPVEHFLLEIGQLSVGLINYGARLTSLHYRSEAGLVVPVILELPDWKSAQEDRSATGATVGRYANRIRNGRFALDGQLVQLECNEGNNHLHGGRRGFAGQVWQTAHDEDTVTLSLRSLAGDGGYPGTVDVQLRVSVLAPATLRLEYEATTDAATIVNLTNHAYFTLGSQPDILAHQLMLKANRFLPADADKLPAGPLEPVADTPFDFRTPAAIGARISNQDDQLRMAGGYDHCFVLDGLQDGENPDAMLTSSEGVRLEIGTTEPGLQVYTANHLSPPHTAVCFETQHFPDSPNHPDYPSTVLRPGETFRSTTTFRLCG